MIQKRQFHALYFIIKICNMYLPTYGSLILLIFVSKIEGK